jgi:hypothetical protein
LSGAIAVDQVGDEKPDGQREQDGPERTDNGVFLVEVKANHYGSLRAFQAFDCFGDRAELLGEYYNTR